MSSDSVTFLDDFLNDQERCGGARELPANLERPASRENFLDEELVALLGFIKTPVDHQDNDLHFEGVEIMSDGRAVAWFSGITDYAYATDPLNQQPNYDSLLLTEIQHAALRAWGEKKRAETAAYEARQAAREQLLKEHGLDDATVRAARAKLLKEHGLD